jgi:hypothetical protein
MGCGVFGCDLHDCQEGITYEGVEEGDVGMGLPDTHQFMHN